MQAINLKIRILAPLALLLALIFGVLIAVLYVKDSKQIENELMHTVQSLQGHYQALLEERSQKLVAMIDMLTEDVGLRKAFKTSDRDELLAYTAPLFKRLKSKHLVTHFYFHTPQRVNLLRVHQPGRYGDTIDRYTMLDAKNRTAISYGVELGPLGTFTLRVVAPVWEQGKILGYIELGEEVDQLMRGIAPVFGVELLVAIEKRFLSRNDWEVGMNMLGRDTHWGQFEDLVIALQTHKLIPEIINPRMMNELKLKSLIPGGVEILDQSKRYQIAAIELPDSAGQVVGKLLVLRDITIQINNSQKPLLLMSAGALFLFVVLVSFFYIVLDRSEDALIERWQVWKK